VSSWRTLVLAGIALAASACARTRGEPMAARARERIVSTPSAIAFAASERDAFGLGDAIRFGGPRGRSALYLKFPGDWRARGIPERAFLTLTARESSAVSNEPVSVEAWRISADWAPRALREWSDKPSLAPPYARRRVTSSPAQVLRIEVSELVRFAAQNPERDFGMAVIASGSDGPGLSFDSGFGGGRAPQLELYFR